MVRSRSYRTLVAAFTLILVLPHQSAQSRPVEIAELGDFFVGGENVTLTGLPNREVVFTPGAAKTVSNPNGDFEVGQMYTQFVKLARPTARYPVLFWHGGGLTGVTWGTTPDGRPGWQASFMRAGFDTYVSDSVERGRSGWARFPEIYKSEPLFRTKKEAWETFRLGPPGSYKDVAKRTAYADTRFPIDDFDYYSKQSVPRWVTNDDLTQKAYDLLVQRVCPCIIIAHSSAVPFAMRAALAAPDKVKAVVSVEAGGIPNPATTSPLPLKQVAFLFIYGDHLQDPQTLPYWRATYSAVQRWHNALLRIGATSTWIDLPRRGIKGNTHLMMMDNNSDQVAAMIQDWLISKIGPH